MPVKHLKKLQYWHYEFARDMASGKHITQLERKWGRKPWNKSTSTIKRLMYDPMIKAEVARINELADTALAKSKARLSLLVQNEAFDIVEKVLRKEPFDPQTLKGDVDYDLKFQAKVATDMIKEQNLGKVDETQHSRIEVIIVDAEKEKEDKESIEDNDLENTLNKVDDE